VLTLIKETHQSLRDDIRCGDFITASVYNVMIKQMLHRDPDGRPDAKQLFHRVEEILDDAKENHERFSADLEERENGVIQMSQQSPRTPPEKPQDSGPGANATGVNGDQRRHGSLDSSMLERQKSRSGKRKERFRNSTGTYSRQTYLGGGMDMFNAATLDMLVRPEPSRTLPNSADATLVATPDNEMPYLTVSQAAKWKSDKKTEAGSERPEGYALLNRLDGDGSYVGKNQALWGLR